MSIRACVFMLTSLAWGLVMCPPARAEVRTIDSTQVLPRPDGYRYWGQDVAIDSGYIIVVSGTVSSQSALLYRRSNSTGQWLYRRVLWTYTGLTDRYSVTMRNGIAAVQFGDEIRLFEQSGGDYVRAPSVAPIRHQGGVAISGNSVLIGGNDCDYDAVIYQKNSAGSWAITGRIDDNEGACLASFQLASVSLSYDYAVLNSPDAREAKVWRRNGSALEWVRAGTLTFEPDEPISNENFALQGATAVSPSGVVWLRTGTSTWTRQGVLTAVNRDNGDGRLYSATYRNGALIASENDWDGTRIFIEASPGHFEHVASLRSYARPSFHTYDVSNGTVVVTVSDIFSTSEFFEVRVFTLPSQMQVPAPVVNDFEDRNASDFTFNGGQFALARRGSDDVLAQSATSGLAIATANDTNWADYQRVQADVTPSFGDTGSWVGLVACHVDADNFYYLTVGAEKYGIYKRVNGVDTRLFEEALHGTMPPTFRLTLQVYRDQISVDLGFQQGTTVTDSSLTHGRAGLATFMSRADFDDVHVAPGDPYGLFYRNWIGNDSESGMDELSGDWEVTEYSEGEETGLLGLSQSDRSGKARAVIGVPVPNQDLQATMIVDSFNTSQQGAWIGLLARYVDPDNFYYATIRSTGQIQIRKQVDGDISLLASANFTAMPGQYYRVRFLVIGDQLQLYVDGSLVASAHDRSFTSGQYGLATYRAAGTWWDLAVFQP